MSECPGGPGRGHGGPGDCHGALVLFWGLVLMVGLVGCGALVWWVSPGGSGQGHGSPGGCHVALFLLWGLVLVVVVVGYVHGGLHQVVQGVGMAAMVVSMGLWSSSGIGSGWLCGFLGVVWAWGVLPGGLGRGLFGHGGQHGALVLSWGGWSVGLVMGGWISGLGLPVGWSLPLWSFPFLPAGWMVSWRHCG